MEKKLYLPGVFEKRKKIGFYQPEIWFPPDRTKYLFQQYVFTRQENKANSEGLYENERKNGFHKPQNQFPLTAIRLFC